jgi:V/A-type H+/Na+-transporting ATPase subunit D
MSGDAVVATRTALLERRRRVDLATQGRDLLRDKRTALVRAFTERSDLLLERLSEVEQAMAAARAAFEEACVAVGPAALRSAALTGRPRLGVEVSSAVIAWVAIVDLRHDEVSRRPLERGYAATTTDPAVDELAAGYEKAIGEFLGLAALELTVRRLAEEIARTTRQVNALEHVLIPRLQDEARRIGLVLAEREREETARLRRARDRRPSPVDEPTPRRNT